MKKLSLKMLFWTPPDERFLTNAAKTFAGRLIIFAHIPIRKKKKISPQLNIFAENVATDT